jgi:hypothetical protein
VDKDNSRRQLAGVSSLGNSPSSFAIPSAESHLMDGACPSPIASCRLLRHPRLAFAAGLPPLHSTPLHSNPTQSARRARARSFHSPHRTRAASWCSRPLVDPRASGRVWIGGAVFPGGVGVKRDALPAPLPGGFGSVAACLRPAGQSHGPRPRTPGRQLPSQRAYLVQLFSDQLF